MNYSEQLYRIMERELGDAGRFVLEKQCKDLNINPHNIEGKNLLRLSRILSGIMGRFGDEKAKRVNIAINTLRTEEAEKMEVKEIVCPHCDTPASADDRTCSKCGADLEEDERAPKLFSEGQSSAEKLPSTVTIIDISRRLVNKRS